MHRQTKIHSINQLTYIMNIIYCVYYKVDCNFTYLVGTLPILNGGSRRADIRANQVSKTVVRVALRTSEMQIQNLLGATLNKTALQIQNLFRKMYFADFHIAPNASWFSRSFHWFSIFRSFGDVGRIANFDPWGTLGYVYLRFFTFVVLGNTFLPFSFWLSVLGSNFWNFDFVVT